MPMYDYKCTECESVTSRFRKVATRHDLLVCDCDGVMKLAILTAPAGKVQEECHYICPATGRQITDRGKRANSFAEFGLEAANPDQQQEIQSRNMKKKAAKDKLAANYLPPELKKQISKIGQNSDNPFIS
jgi:putative FmdB family regulatory protein